MAGESAPDAPLACVLSNFSSTVGLEFVLAASGCGAPGATPAGVEGPTPHEAAVASPGEMEGVAPGEDFPPSCEKTPPSLIDDVSRDSDRCHRKIPSW